MDGEKNLIVIGILNKYSTKRVANKFAQLTEEQKKLAELGIRRHAIVCRKFGMRLKADCLREIVQMAARNELSFDPNESLSELPVSHSQVCSTQRGASMPVMSKRDSVVRQLFLVGDLAPGNYYT